MVQSLRIILTADPKLVHFWAKTWPKLPTFLKAGFFGKFHLGDFFLVIVPYYAAKSEKKS